MIVFKNGSLARERVRNEHAQGSWEEFGRLLRETPPGNKERSGFFFFQREICPHVEGVFYFDGERRLASGWPEHAAHVRAIVEAQMLALYTHALDLGLVASGSLVVTGGASQSPELVQVLSNVFGLPVYTIEATNSASLGAALRALHALLALNEPSLPFEAVCGAASERRLVASPNAEAHAAYTDCCRRFRVMERTLQ